MLDGVGREDLEEIGVDYPVPAQRGVHVFNDRAAPQHPLLFALQTRLLADFRKRLFVGCNTGLNEATYPCPAQIIAADALAPARQQDARFRTISAYEEAGNNRRFLYA